jgi:hypothetical protein
LAGTPVFTPITPPVVGAFSNPLPDYRVKQLLYAGVDSRSTLWTRRRACTTAVYAKAYGSVAASDATTVNANVLDFNSRFEKGHRCAPHCRSDDIESMTHSFTMFNGNELVKCTISSAALVDLSGDRWKRPPNDRGSQFEEFRDQIEGLASEIFDATPIAEGRIIRIFAKHLPKAGIFPLLSRQK